MVVGVGATNLLTQAVCRAALTAAGKVRPARGRKPGMSTHHRTLPVSCRPDGPPVDVVLWRRCRLLEAGFPEALAMRLANARIDLHALLQLVDRGCPPELAARILAPVDEPARRMPGEPIDPAPDLGAHQTGTPR